MKKVPGSFLLECYSKWGEKKKTILVNGYIQGIKKAKHWERKKGRTCVLSRILYNTKANWDKWYYNPR